MTEPERDDELLALFAEKRAAEAAWVPDFERVRDGRGLGRRSRRSWPWVMVSAGVVAAVVAVVMVDRAPDSAEPVPAGLAELRSATDFLLEIPGAENLTTVPRIGDVNGWFSLDETEKGSRL